MPMPLAGIQNLRARAAQGDPQAQQELQMLLQELSGGTPGGGGASGGPPPVAAPGGMPPGGAPGMGGPPGVPPGQGQLSPQGGGAPIPADVQARRAQDLIRILRARGDR